MKKWLILMLGCNVVAVDAATITWQNVGNSASINNNGVVYSSFGNGNYAGSDGSAYSSSGNHTYGSNGYHAYDNEAAGISVVSPTGNVSTCSQLYNSVVCN